MNEQRTALIAGGGPAGLTAAYELLHAVDANIKPVVFEKLTLMGGISRTVNYRGNRIDIGGHRFFSKSDAVMDWWLNILPLQDAAHDPNKTDEVMLRRSRKSRILWMRKLFDYPLTLSAATLKKLGLLRTLRIGMSYIRAAIFKRRPEVTLEDFFINRFGRTLYKLFFRGYTEKVWGVPCNKIPAAWGAQRVKGVSVTKAMAHAMKQFFLKKSSKKTSSDDIRQKDFETSLIESFLYPKFGPGQLWELVATRVEEMGSEVLRGWEIVGVKTYGGKITGVMAKGPDGQMKDFAGDFLISSMPLKDLIESLDCDAPGDVKQIAAGLAYRDFITVGLLAKDVQLKGPDGWQKMIADNWIYIQEADIKAGRLQLFNNWSPYMVADAGRVWLGLEYFCNEGDDFWSRSDAEILELAKEEMARCNIVKRDDVLDGVVVRDRKAYPAYFGTFDRIGELRKYLDSFGNLFCVGRNGQHRYNNMDHSMLTAMQAVKNILNGSKDKSNVWAVNVEQEYHEENSK